MRVYEVLFIIAPTVEEGDVEALTNQISEVLTNQGATISKVDNLGRRRLAYPIQKFNEGYYVVLTVEGTGNEIAEAERRMRVTDSIIRYLTIRIDEDLKRAEKIRARRAVRAAAAAARGRRRPGDAPRPRPESRSEEEEAES